MGMRFEVRLVRPRCPEPALTCRREAARHMVSEADRGLSGVGEGDYETGWPVVSASV